MSLKNRLSQPPLQAIARSIRSIRRRGAPPPAPDYPAPAEPEIESELSEPGSPEPPLSRAGRLLQRVDRSMRLIEIGPSHMPLAPKSDGWRTTIVDHASREELITKYANHTVIHANIEEVDVIWSGGDLAGSFPQDELGQYDGILASHVMEHMPDPISFLISAQKLLKPEGIVVLAMPDKRCTFDIFQPMTSTADWLLAHEIRARTHSKRAAFNHVAYLAADGEKMTWHESDRLDQTRLVHTLQQGVDHFRMNTEAGDSAIYHDYHAWHVTSSSFALLILESTILLDIDLHLIECSATHGHEFYAVLARGRPNAGDTAALNAQRLALLKATIQELQSGPVVSG